MTRVWVVDDDADFVESTMLVLSAAGHEVRAGREPAEVGAGWRVIVDRERVEADDGGFAALVARGARLVTVDKPIAPPALLAAIATA